MSEAAMKREDEQTGGKRSGSHTRLVPAIWLMVYLVACGAITCGGRPMLPERAPRKGQLCSEGEFLVTVSYTITAQPPLRGCARCDYADEVPTMRNGTWECHRKCTQRNDCAIAAAECVMGSWGIPVCTSPGPRAEIWPQI